MLQESMLYNEIKSEPRIFENIMEENEVVSQVNASKMKNLHLRKYFDQ